MNTPRVPTVASLKEETIRDKITLLQRFNGHRGDDVNERPSVTLWHPALAAFLFCPFRLISTQLLTNHQQLEDRGRGERLLFPGRGPLYSVFCCLDWRGQIQFIFMSKKKEEGKKIHKWARGGSKNIGDRRQTELLLKNVRNMLFCDLNAWFLT